MQAVARYAKATAKPGHGDELARIMLEVAQGLRETPGCELYVINRSVGEPDVIWVTELWESRQQLDAALETEGARARIPEVLALLSEGGLERIDLEPIGGVGFPLSTPGCTIVNLEEVEDMAPKFGLSETGESRFARTALGAVGIGLSLQRLRPHARQPFGHRHALDEEAYVVLRGSGRVAVDEQVYELREMDAIRLGPGSIRAFEAGPDGLELLATGTHRPGDAEMIPGFGAL